MKTKNEKKIINEINIDEQNINEKNLNNPSENHFEMNTKLNLQNIRSKNRKFIEEIFESSVELNELIPKIKENSSENIKEFFKLLIQISKEKIINEEEENYVII